MNNNRKALVLLVDDNYLNLKILADIVEDEGHEAVLATDGIQALEFVQKECPDIILLDIMMPHMDGYEVCTQLKHNEKTRDIPVLFLTAKAEAKDIVRGFQVGGVDYLVKPYNPLEFKARLKTHLALKWALDDLKEFNERLQKANELITQQNEKMREIMDALKAASITDSLTGLYNRRYLTDRMEEEAARYNRTQRKFSIIIGDIDFFKKVNDSYGHDCGDYVLKEVSRIQKQLIREQDSIARWGGEEFLILLPETDIVGAQATAERLRQGIQDHDYLYKGKPIYITMTFGVAEFDDGKTVDKVIIEADNALYQGKAEGKNRVTVARQPQAPELNNLFEP